MQVLYERCCGLDVHKQSVVACLITPDAQGQPAKAVRTFGTTTDALQALATWLADAGCTHVALEATGVYWRPVHNLLEDRFELLLVNPRHIKATTADCPHGQDGLSWCACHRHGPRASALRAHVPTG